MKIKVILISGFIFLLSACSLNPNHKISIEKNEAGIQFNVNIVKGKTLQLGAFIYNTAEKPFQVKVGNRECPKPVDVTIQTEDGEKLIFENPYKNKDCSNNETIIKTLEQVLTLEEELNQTDKYIWFSGTFYPKDNKTLSSGRYIASISLNGMDDKDVTVEIPFKID